MLKKLYVIFVFTLVNQFFILASILSDDIKTFYKDLPVLVTGGAGFIGSHIVTKLVELGAHVTILDDLSSGDESNIKNIEDKIIFIEGSITDFQVCLEATKNKKIIFHLAAFISVPDSMHKPYLCHLNNDVGTLNILEAARMNNVDRVIFSSSCAVYGTPAKEKCSEVDVCSPESAYGYSKYIGEQYMKEYAKFFNVNTVVLRYFNVYGNRQNPNGAYAAVVAKFTDLMKKNEPVIIYGDGLQTRDFVSVGQVVRANLFFGSCKNIESIKGEIFNIATGESINLLELFDSLKKQFPEYQHNPIFMPARVGDVKHISADVMKYDAFKSSYDCQNNK